MRNRLMWIGSIYTVGTMRLEGGRTRPRHVMMQMSKQTPTKILKRMPTNMRVCWVRLNAIESILSPVVQFKCNSVVEMRSIS